MTLNVIAATKKHAKELAAAGLRNADVMECKALDTKPRKAIIGSWEASKICWAALDHKDRVVCLFGAAQHPTDPKMGVPWLLGSHRLEDHATDLVMRAPIFIDRMLRTYDKLANVVHEKNEASIRWLKHMGFTFSDKAHPYGAKQEKFYIFYKAN